MLSYYFDWFATKSQRWMTAFAQQYKSSVIWNSSMLTFFSVSKGCFKSRQIPRLWKVFRRFGLDRSTREAFQALQNFGSLKLLKMFSTTQHPANIIPELLLGQKYYIFISIKGALRLPTTYDNHPSNPVPSHPSDI